MKYKLKNKKLLHKIKENKESQRKNLYKILLYIYKFQQLEDFLFLKKLPLLKLCGVSDIHWNFNKAWLEKDFLTDTIERNYPFQWACPLNCKNNHYGELLFFSSQKFSAQKKTFLKKITFFTASALYFIESKEKMKNIKQQWGGAFDSFSQAFCITDKNFKIIRTNQSFQKITSKTDLFSKNLFELFPIPVKIPEKEEQEGLWLAKGHKHGKPLCLEISFKPLFLKKEKIQAFLFLIKDVTKEIEIEEKLSAQAKERELGIYKRKYCS